MPPRLRTNERPTGSLPVGLGPHEIFKLFTGLDVPDIITFVMGEKWLDRANLYPRQATLLKIIFLRDDLFTEYDHKVIDQWEMSFRQTGNNGIVPGVRERITILRGEGRKWFRETLLVLGRRAGKGHISGLSMAYVLWNYMAKGDPQGYYGVDRDKKLQAMVFAGKRDQAKATVWQDAVNYITGSECFAPYIRAPLQAEKLSIYAPHDFIRMKKRMKQGMNPDDINMATFELVPKESTLMAGRGPTSFMQCLDPKTPVLTADLRWVPIGELNVGDRLVGIDEYSQTKGSQRKLRETEVTHIWRTRKEALRLTFVDGTSVVCSADHRWLVRDMGKGGATHWRTAGRMSVGNHIKHLVDPWDGVAPRGGVIPSGRETPDSHKTIASIEELPKRELVDITTTTRTFIANGLISHNCYDEMAHVVAAGANRSAEEVYSAATPSLDQFGKDGFIIEPSSPWQMLGQFYTNYCNSILMDEHSQPVYPEMLMIQLASWESYEDWEIAHEIPVFPEGYKGDLGEYEDEPPLYFRPLRGAIQAYDDQMARLEQSNPETFKVERRSHFAVAMDAYLNEEKVKQIFAPWPERNPHFGGPQLGMQVRGRLDIDYMAHGDPSKSNKNFGLALAHTEPGPDGRLHVVFDKIHHFEPGDFQDHIIDYDEVEEWIWDNMMAPFMPNMMTFDQFNSAQVIGRLQKRARNSGLPKTTMVAEETATKQHNWKRAEIFKTAMNMGWIHAPYHEQGELELRFLQEKNGVVDHPTSGPVQSKDVADCLMEVTMKLIGDQIISLRSELGAMRPTGAMPGGISPFPGMSRPDLSSQDRSVMDQLSGFGRARGDRPGSVGPMGRGRGRRG